MKPPSLTTNRLLEALPPQSRNRLQHLLTPVTLRRGLTLHEPGGEISEVVFPTTAVVSVVTRMVNGETVESATVGNEGMIGIPVFLTAGPTVEAFVQIPGDALKIDSRQLLLIAQEDAAMDRLFAAYTALFIRFMSQSSACNRVHSLRERCARWLLMANNRNTGDTFPLTQQFLGEMMGVSPRFGHRNDERPAPPKAPDLHARSHPNPRPRRTRRSLVRVLRNDPRRLRRAPGPQRRPDESRRIRPPEKGGAEGVTWRLARDTERTECPALRLVYWSKRGPLMRTRWALAVGLLVSLAVVVHGNQTVAAHPERLGVKIEVSPGPQRGHFLVTAKVNELETGSVIWAPRVSTLPGILATVKSDDDKASYKWKATFLVKEATANYTIEGSKNGEPVFSTTGAIQLEPSGLLPAN